jgi:nucleotide-binding universal stress UspA family protein
MSPADRFDEIRRILIALDASPASQAALELAADLAERHKAELVGIYVEDINLLRSADFDFSEEVGEFSAISRRVNSQLMANEMKAHARRIEEMLSTIAGRANLTWTFRSVRGLIPGELIAAAENTDLIILGKRGWSEGKSLGSTARQLVSLSPVQSLILEHKVHPGTPVLVVYDGSPDSLNALKTAGRICSPGSKLTILVPAEDQQSAEEIYAGLERWITEQDFEIQFRWVSDLKGKRISNLALLSGCGIVILPAQSKHFKTEAIISMVEIADCAVLLVR